MSGFPQTFHNRARADLFRLSGKTLYQFVQQRSAVPNFLDLAIRMTRGSGIFANGSIEMIRRSVYSFQLFRLNIRR